MWLRIETSILCNRSFAAGNSSRAKHKLGQNKQKDHITENCNFLCLCSFNESLALQHGDFVPGEWIASCKGPMCPDPDWRFRKTIIFQIQPIHTSISLMQIWNDLQLDVGFLLVQDGVVVVSEMRPRIHTDVSNPPYFLYSDPWIKLIPWRVTGWDWPRQIKSSELFSAGRCSFNPNP